MNRRNTLLWVGAGVLVGAGLGLFLVLGLGLGREWLTGLVGPAEAALVPEESYHASDFTLETLNGDQLHLQDLRGGPVVINFWATWCGPCRDEMPLLESYYRKYQPDLVVIGINFDEPRQDVEEYVDALGLTFPILLDPRGRVEDLYRVRAFPTTFFLDAEGRVRYQHIGELNRSQLAAYLDKIGAEQ